MFCNSPCDTACPTNTRRPRPTESCMFVLWGSLYNWLVGVRQSWSHVAGWCWLADCQLSLHDLTWHRAPVSVQQQSQSCTRTRTNCSLVMMVDRYLREPNQWNNKYRPSAFMYNLLGNNFHTIHRFYCKKVEDWKLHNEMQCLETDHCTMGSFWFQFSIVNFKETLPSWNLKKRFISNCIT